MAPAKATTVIAADHIAAVTLESIHSEGEKAGCQLLRKRVAELENMLAAEVKLASEENFVENVVKAKAEVARD